MHAQRNLEKKIISTKAFSNSFYNNHTAHRNCAKCENTKRLLHFIHYLTQLCRFWYRSHKNIRTKLFTIKDLWNTVVKLTHLCDLFVLSSIYLVGSMLLICFLVFSVVFLSLWSCVRCSPEFVSTFTFSLFLEYPLGISWQLYAPLRYVLLVCVML